MTYDGSGAITGQTKLNGQGLDYMVANPGSTGDGFLKFGRPDEREAAVIANAYGTYTTNPDGTEDYNRTGADPATVPLKENEFVTSYVMDLGPYYGNGDSTSEIAGNPVDRDAADAATDFYLLGRPYIYKGEKNPLTGSVSDKADATNSFNARYYRYADPLKPLASGGWKANSNAGVEHQESDQGYYLGYLIPFKDNYSLNAKNNNAADVSMYDYARDNKTPNLAEFEARFWNSEDEDMGLALDARPDGPNRIAHISHARLTSELHDTFRLQKVYVPAEFVPDHTGHDVTWFQANKFTLTIRNTVGTTTLTKDIVLTWKDMRDAGILSDAPLASGDHAGDYVIDVEKYLRDHADELTLSYQAVDATNTIPGFKGDATVDLAYAKPAVAKVSFEFDSPNADRAKPETMLDSGEYLSPLRERHLTASAGATTQLVDRDGKALPAGTQPHYAYAFDGVYVDRTVENFKAATATTATDLEAGRWDYTSTPTFCKDGNDFDTWKLPNKLVVDQVTTKDPNFKALVDQSKNTAAPTANYLLSHRLAIMETSLTRGKTVQTDAGAQTVFAYDFDDRSITTPVSYDPASGEVSDIPNGDVYAGDYIEYLLYVGTDEWLDEAAKEPSLPLEQVDARFDTAPGQRVVGWEVAKVQKADGTWVNGNATGLDVKAFLSADDGTAQRPAPEKTDLSLDAGAEGLSQNRDLLFQIGEYDAADPDASGIAPGKGLWLRVITQATDELNDDPDYHDDGNTAYEDDNPSYQNQTVESNFYAVARPKHGYTQYRATSLSHGKGGLDWENKTGYATDSTSPGSALEPIRYASVNDIALRYDGKGQLAARDYSNIRFHYHKDDVIKLDAQFTTNTPSNSAVPADGDGNPAQLTVSDIENYTRHTNDLQVTVRFTDGNVGGDPSGKVLFELTETPKIAASNKTVLTEGGAVVDLRYPKDMPANGVGPVEGEDGSLVPGRPAIKVEYFDSGYPTATADPAAYALQPAALMTGTDLARAASAPGKWVSYAELVARYGATTPDATDEGHSANGNLFRKVTGVRWTYYDVPATKDGAAPYELEDVALVGVGRYADLRALSAQLPSSEQANSWTPTDAADLALTHYHNESTVLDFYDDPVVGAAPAPATPGAAVEHGQWLTKQDEGATRTLKVYRRTPVMQFQGQVFQTEAMAEAAWDVNAAQKLGYVPGEQFWYKNSLKNVPKNTNPGIHELEGELYNPVLYERIPSDYLKTTDGGQIDAAYLERVLQVRWTDRDGDDVSAARLKGMRLKVEAVAEGSGEALDYGGAMTYARAAATRGHAGYRAFTDLNPTAANASRPTEFTLLKISWVADGDDAGSEVDPDNAASRPVDVATPGNSRMEVGDLIEVWFPVRAAVDGLPQVYLDLGATGALTGNAGVEPAYFPRMGEYYYYPYAYGNSASGRINQMNGTIFDGTHEMGSPVYVNTASNLMDLDSLLLDSAFSGDKAEQTDVWEMFDGSLTWIPGVETTHQPYYNWWDVNNWGVEGSRGIFLDEDVRTARNKQRVRYTPRPYADTVGDAKGLLPSSTRYEGWWDSGSANTGGTAQANDNGSSLTNRYVRDYYSFVTKARTQGDMDSQTERWGSTVPLVWSETRVHMQKAWLATSSDFITDQDGDAKASRKYPSGVDSRYWWRVGDTDYAGQWLRDRSGLINGHYVTALEYNQDFTSQLIAYNYGDRTLDGVEFTYVMPRGVEPKFADNAAADGIDMGDLPALSALMNAEATATAYVMTNRGTPQDQQYDPHVSDKTWDPIDQAKVRIEVLQSPASAYAGYDAPSAAQDPGVYRSGATPTVADLSADTEKSTYTSVPSDSANAHSAEYRDSSQPWVIRVTVEHDLGKWYGRAIDGTDANTADPDEYGDNGYQIAVNLASHVFGSNEDGAWYDRLLTRPVDVKPAGDDTAAGQEPSKSSAYYQVMDVDHFEGGHHEGQKHMQVYGMDWKETINTRWLGEQTYQQLYGSPNMPSINGYTIQNATVRTDEGNAMGSVARNDGFDGFWSKAYKGGDAAVGADAVVYAQTGTRAVQRKPLVRVWNTIGENGVSGDSTDYYLAAETDTRQLNIHVENRYWWDQYARYSWYNWVQEQRTANYTTNGGQKGDLILPVVTTVLPEGMAPVHRGTRKPYGEWPGVEQEMDLADWDVAYSYNAYAGNTAEVTANEADDWKGANFRATVTYEQVNPETSYDDDEPQYRFVVRFTAKGDDLDHAEDAEQRIPALGMDTFKFDISLVEEPEWPEEPDHLEAGRANENIRTYVTSKMTGYQFLTDNDIANNPFTVGAPARYRGETSVGDNHHVVDRYFDKRLDAPVESYLTTWRDDSSSEGRHNDTTPRISDTYEKDSHRPADYQDQSDYYKRWVRFMETGALPRNYYNDGTQTREGVQKSPLTGYFGKYTETDGTYGAGLKSVALAGPEGDKGLNASDYTFRRQYALSSATTQGLNGNDAAEVTEKFQAKTADAPRTHTDAGVYATLKLRFVSPTFSSSYEAELEPADRPRDDDPATWSGASTSTGKGAQGTNVLNNDGTVSAAGDPDKPFEYADTPWFAATLRCANPDGTASVGGRGALNHGKLVFALYLPDFVTFYDHDKLVNAEDDATGAFERYLADYEGDDYAFYVERTYKDRHNGNAVTHEKLTPKQLVARGWTVNVTTQPAYDENNFTDPDYGKPDADDPTDAPDDPTVKPKAHEGEVVVFELAPPDDASDEEFDKYDSLLAAYWGGVHPDGYLGYQDVVTLKVRTRVDSLGSEESATDGMLVDGRPVGYREQMDTIRSWDGESCQAYYTTEERQLQWMQGDDWDHTYTAGDKAGTTASKPVRPDDPLADFGVDDFAAQSPVRFFLSGTKAQDSPAYVDQVTGDEMPAIDLDCDGEYDDVYVGAQAGWFRVRKPMASVRADTAVLRRQITDPDFTTVTLADDGHDGGNNQFYLTQAINTGGAVNSFIVDWQVPWWSTGDSTITDAPFQSKTTPIGRIEPSIARVNTGVWEVPGAAYKYVDAAGAEVDASTPGARRVPANEEAETESKLRVFVYVRKAPNDPSAALNGYDEQNGAAYIDHENFALPGTDADRDYFYGEDDADDFNTADGKQGTWQLVGSRAGYAVSDKQNTAIPINSAGNEDVRQVRWVIKAVGEDGDVSSDYESHVTPVPHGFRLAVDAMPDDLSTPEKEAATKGAQEADDIDPNRNNIGWQWYTMSNGDYLLNADGEKMLKNGTDMPTTITSNAAGVLSHTRVSEDPTIQQRPIPLYEKMRKGTHLLATGVDDGISVLAEGDVTGATTASHINHFVSAVPRYDDTKFVEAERDRAGFYRDPEFPYIKIDMSQSYFSGNYRTEYSWSTGTPAIDPGGSRMMRYSVQLTNLSAEQLAALGVTGAAKVDYCSNPQISMLLPFIEGYGAATALSDADFRYVPASEAAKPTHPLNMAYKSVAVTRDEPILDKDGNPVYILDGDGNKIQKTDEDGNPVFDEDGNPVWLVEMDTVVVTPAQNLNAVKPMWTYRVVDVSDDLTTTTPADASGVNDVRLSDPRIGGSLLIEDKAGSATVKTQRKFMNWRFTGAPYGDGTLRKGSLDMGQAVIVDILMPIRSDASSAVSRDLLMASSYAYKDGNFNGYVPAIQTTADRIALERDSRDVNLDGKTDQKMVCMQLAALGFVSSETISQKKESTTDLNSMFNEAVNGPAAAPEGSSYTYEISALNVGADAEKAKGYIRTAFMDILPYEGDTKVKQLMDGEPVGRKSQWNGWLDDLDSVKLVMMDPLDEDNPNGRVMVTEGAERDLEAKLWVGPIATRGGKLVPLPESGITPPYAQSGETQEDQYIIEWMDAISQDDAGMASINMVNLNTLKQYVEDHPDEAEKLKKAIRFVWMRVVNDNSNLPCQGYIRLSYDLRTPLNLPKYNGTLTGDRDFDMNEVDGQPDANPGLAARLAEVTQWNTYAQRQTTGGASGSTSLKEEVMAGVFVDAPEGRGYIGDYVWLDTDWNGLQDDTLGELTTDGLGRSTTYHKADNGRFLLSTDKEIDPQTGVWTGLYGNGQPTSALFKDVNFDGVAEDPGVNGVKVELLNEYGWPCNRDGEVAVLRNDDKTGFEDRWVVADPQTGVPLRSDLDGYISADNGEPYSYVTESDYYDNKGYYILSNLKPGKYKLRFTFPQEYAWFSLTTQSIGPDDARNPLSVERKNNQMIATTTKAIDVEAVAYDKDKFAAGEPDPVHERYDARMTSYDVGLARPVTINGVAFRDDMLEDLTEEDPDDINGVLDWVGADWDNADKLTTEELMASGTEQKELRLQNMRVVVHEYDPETDTYDPEPAITADGVAAAFNTDAQGRFEFRLIPDRHYVITCEDNRQRLLKPTVYTWANGGPLEMPGANGVWDNDLKIVGGVNQTAPFELKVPVDDAGHAVYENAGQQWLGFKHYRKFALGWVDGTKGYLGDYVWNDENYNGVQNGTETGIAGVKVTLEQYWWRPNGHETGTDGIDGAWVPVPEDRMSERLKASLTQTTTPSGSYMFKGIPTYVPDPEASPNIKDEDKKKYLAGYRLRIDRELLRGLSADWALSLRNRALDEDGNPDEALDSDASSTVRAIPAHQQTLTPAPFAADNAFSYYLNEGAGSTVADEDVAPDGMIVVADRYQEGTSLPENSVLVGEGSRFTRYDLAAAVRVDHWDAGLVEVPRSTVTGRVWQDEDYDGIQSFEAEVDEDGNEVTDAEGNPVLVEPGVPGQVVTLTQWFYDPARTNPDDGGSHWFRNEAFGADDRTGVRAVDENGVPQEDADGNPVWAGPVVTGGTAANGVVSVRTGEDGTYAFDNLPTAYTDPQGAHFLAGYRVRLAELNHSVDANGNDNYWLLSRYHATDSDAADEEGAAASTGLDSDVPDSVESLVNMVVQGREAFSADSAAFGTRAHDGQIILAGEVDAGGYEQWRDSHVQLGAGEVLVSDEEARAFDWLTTRVGEDEAVDGGDVGQLPSPVRDIVGVIWDDVVNDGIQSDEFERDENGALVMGDDGKPKLLEPGVNGIQVTLERYVSDGAGGWEDDLTWATQDEWDAYRANYTNGLGASDRGHNQQTAKREAADGELSDGVYRWNDLPTQTRVDGEVRVYAYRMRVTEPRYKTRGFLTAKYERGDDPTLDSNLNYHDAYLMKVDGSSSGEYTVLLDVADGSSVASNKVQAGNSYNDNWNLGLIERPAEAARALAALGEPAAPRDTAPTEPVLTYDAAKGSDRAYNDGGVRMPQSQVISGYVWNDRNYNGLIDEGEQMLDGKRVILRPWVWANGKWNEMPESESIEFMTGAALSGSGPADPQPGDPGYEAGKPGYYEFRDSPVCTNYDPDDPDGQNYDPDKQFLMGYTLEVQGEGDAGVTGLPVTRLLAQPAKADADEATDDAAAAQAQADEVNSKAHRPGDASLSKDIVTPLAYGAGNYPLAWGEPNHFEEPDFSGTARVAADSDGGFSVVDGRIVIAAPTTKAEATDLYYRETTAGGFDISEGRDELRLNAGFGPFQTTVIRGIVWNDENYDGLRNFRNPLIDAEGTTPPVSVIDQEEQPVPGQRVFLTQWYQHPVTGEWTLNKNFGSKLPEVGDLTATDTSVTVKRVVDGTEYAIYPTAGLAPGALPDLTTLTWYGDDGAANPWPGKEGVFEGLDPAVEYAVICRHVAARDELCETPMMVMTLGAATVTGPSGTVRVSADSLEVTAPPAGDAPYGWEYTLADDPTSPDAVWVAGDEAGRVVFDGLESGRSYAVTARARGKEAVEGPGTEGPGTDEPEPGPGPDGPDGPGDSGDSGTDPDGGDGGDAGTAGDGGEPAGRAGADGAGDGDAGAGDADGSGDGSGDGDGDGSGEAVPPGPPLAPVTVVTLPEGAGSSVGYVPNGTTTPQPSVTPAPLGAKASTTDAQGIYAFEGLPSYLQLDAAGNPVAHEERGAADDVCLVAYRVSLGELKPGFAPSRYDVPKAGADDQRYDSDLTRDEGGRLVLAEHFLDGAAKLARKDGYVLTSVEAAAGDGHQYEDAYKSVTYDTPKALATQRGGDAGVKEVSTTHVSGIVWDDLNHDGIRQTGERGHAGQAVVRLTRYWYKPEGVTSEAPDAGTPDGGDPDAGTPDGPTTRDAAADAGPGAGDGGADGTGPDAGGNPDAGDGAGGTGDDDPDAGPGAGGGDGADGPAAGDGADEEEAFGPEPLWVYDRAFNGEGEDAYPDRERVVEADGTYRFDDLPATGLQVVGGEEIQVVYGYRVNLVELPAGYDATPRDRGGDATVDSDLDDATTRLIPDEPVDGLILLAVREQPGEAAEVLIEGPQGAKWSTATVKESEHNDAGVAPFSSALISGWVWEDADKDGIQLEDLSDVKYPGMVVTLERRSTSLADAVADGWHSRTTDGVKGSHLDLSGEPLEKAPRTIEWFDLGPAEGPDGPTDPDEPNKPEEPGGPDGPADPEPGPDDGPDGPDGPDAPDAEGDEPGFPDAAAAEDGRLVMDEPLLAMVRARLAAEGSAGGKDDADASDKNDADDDPEEVIDPNERVEFDGILSEGTWEKAGQTVTDEDGCYRFVVPVVDAQGKPYQYRLRMDKPDGTEYVPLNAGGSDALDNEWAHLNLVGQRVPEHEGITDVLAPLGRKASGPNAYGLTYATFAPASWARHEDGTGNPVDLGLHTPIDPEDPDNPPSPDDPRNPLTPDRLPRDPKHPVLLGLPQTGDDVSWIYLVLTAAGVSVALIFLALLFGRRREEEEA